MRAARDGFYLALGRNIRRARERARLTQGQLADAIGLSRTSVTNLECGRQTLQVHVLAHLSEVLREEPHALLPKASVVEGDPELERKLQSLDPDARDWAMRVLSVATVNEEEPDAD
jgi:transcriptional regulator with XRE-family HTH domain